MEFVEFAEGRKQIAAARRIVIKLGTSTVTGDQGELCGQRVVPIVRSIAKLMRGGRQVVLISSGAVGLGRGLLRLHPSRLKDMAVKQACAAAGQSLLMEGYKRLFDETGTKIAQVLLTEEDFSNWTRYSNFRRTMEKLIGFGVLPIVNENDTVSTAELETIRSQTRSASFSDNDRLAALVMSGLEADALILMTNVPGLLRASSGTDGSRRTTSSLECPPVSAVERITPELKALAAGPSHGGRGGMITKIDAAAIATSCGGWAAIVDGRDPEILEKLFAGEQVGTIFLPVNRMKGKRRWLAYAAGVRGRVVVDAGAYRAITGGKASLLTSGVVRVDRQFDTMDVVSILDVQGREFARGIANCASEERAKGQVLFTRNNIVVLQAEK